MPPTTDTPDKPAPIVIVGDTDVLWRIAVGEKLFELRPGAVTPAQSSALRLHSYGAWKVTSLFASIDADGIGPDELLGLVYLAERQGAQLMSYDQVSALIDAAIVAGTEVRIDMDATPEVDDPES